MSVSLRFTGSGCRSAVFKPFLLPKLPIKTDLLCRADRYPNISKSKGSLHFGSIEGASGKVV
jgi:hypothetical protein